MFDYRVSQQVFYSQNSETQLGYDQTGSKPEVVSNVFAGILSHFRFTFRFHGSPN